MDLNRVLTFYTKGNQASTGDFQNIKSYYALGERKMFSHRSLVTDKKEAERSE